MKSSLLSSFRALTTAIGPHHHQQSSSSCRIHCSSDEDHGSGSIIPRLSSLSLEAGSSNSSSDCETVPHLHVSFDLSKNQCFILPSKKQLKREAAAKSLDDIVNHSHNDQSGLSSALNTATQMAKSSILKVRKNPHFSVEHRNLCLHVVLNLRSTEYEARRRESLDEEDDCESGLDYSQSVAGTYHNHLDDSESLSTATVSTTASEESSAAEESDHVNKSVNNDEQNAHHHRQQKRRHRKRNHRHRK